MLKSIVSLYFLALIFTARAVRFELNESIVHFLGHLKESDLPESVRSSLHANQGRAGGPSDSSHYCCVNEQPITTVTQTKIEYATHAVATKTKVGYVDCGFLGMMKCSHYVTSYRTERYTYVQTFQVPNMAACAAHEVKCCAGYISVADNCHSITDLVANQELFQFLANLGLLTLPGVGK